MKFTSEFGRYVGLFFYVLHILTLDKADITAMSFAVGINEQLKKEHDNERVDWHVCSDILSYLWQYGFVKEVGQNCDGMNIYQFTMEEK